MVNSEKEEREKPHNVSSILTTRWRVARTSRSARRGMVPTSPADPRSRPRSSRDAPRWSRRDGPSEGRRRKTGEGEEDRGGKERTELHPREFHVLRCLEGLDLLPGVCNVKEGTSRHLTLPGREAEGLRPKNWQVLKGGWSTPGCPHPRPSESEGGASGSCGSVREEGGINQCPTHSIGYGLKNFRLKTPHSSKVRDHRFWTIPKPVAVPFYTNDSKPFFVLRNTPNLLWLLYPIFYN